MPVQQNRPVVYLIVCGSPAAREVYGFVSDAMAGGWTVCVVPTPSGAAFLDVARLEALTGYPVRTTYKHPDEPDVLPPADALVVAPATFNTLNKTALGITDSLAVGLICEGLGYGRPIIMVPWFNEALSRHGSVARSTKWLADEGITMIRESQGEPFPWARVMDELTTTYQHLRGDHVTDDESAEPRHA